MTTGTGMTATLVQTHSCVCLKFAPVFTLVVHCVCLKSKANINKFPGLVRKRRFRTLLGQHKNDLGAKRYHSSQRQEPGPPSQNPGCASHGARGNWSARTDLLSAFPVAHRARNKLVCFFKVRFVWHLLCRTVCHIPASIPTGTKQLSHAARAPSRSSPGGWLPMAAAMCCWLSKAQNVHPRVSRGRQGCNPLQVI